MKSKHKTLKRTFGLIEINSTTVIILKIVNSVIKRMRKSSVNEGLVIKEFIGLR